MTAPAAVVYNRPFSLGAVMSIRFIAGAVCPRCGEMDTLRAGYEDDGDVMVRECVDCGFSDRISQTANQAAEPATRVNRSRPVSRANTIPVTQIDPDPSSEDSSQ